MHTHTGRIPWHKTRLFFGVVATLVVLLIALRAVAPLLVRRAVNDALAGMEGYRAGIVDVDLSLWRGAYQIEGLVIEKIEGKSNVPFIDIDVIDLSVSWRALIFERALVSEVVVTHPELTFVARRQMGPKNVDWRARVESLFPFRINRVELRDATVRYRDPQAAPQPDLVLTSLNGTIENITNSLDLADPLPTALRATGEAFDTGAVKLHMDLDPWAATPKFNLDASVRAVPLKAFNGYADEYGKFDFDGGTVSVFVELAAASGKFQGYVKPLLKDVQIADAPNTDTNEPWYRKAWEVLVGGASEVVENQPREQVATKIPINGRFDDPKAGVMEAAATVLVNAFVRALRPGIDDEVDERDARRLTREGDARAAPKREGILDKLLGNGSNIERTHDDPAVRKSDVPSEP